MLSVFFGNDAIKVRKAAFDFMQSLTTDDSLVTRITTDTYEEGMVTDIAGGSSLFGGEQVCVIDTLSDDAQAFENMLSGLEVMTHSPHHFIVIESTLTAPLKKKFEVHKAEMQEISAEKKETFNAFSLTDALLRRDKKTLWLLLNEAWREGLSNEEIIGVLMWQLKILRLVEKTKSAEEAGQKPFVYQKAKRALSAFKKGELDTLSKNLLTVYHDGHLGLHDTALALERWVLTL